MTSVRIDAEVIFQVKSRRDPITQSLWRSYAEHFLAKCTFAYSHGRGRS
ncbi:hypothetical protein GGD64_007139 [Bradyrhizobium sp. CIR3A]|nr:hypothetical protein [Bradyrhizobium sp. CIR3A]